MKLKKWFLLLVMGLSLALVLAACGKKDNASGGDKSGGDKKEEVEQVFNLMIGDYIPTMDSSKATDQYAFLFLNATMEGLYRLGPEGKIEEGIAKSHEVSEDGLTWTFHLRDNAKWSNGDPVTAHDFVYAWRRAVDPNTGSEYGPYMMNGVIKNATAVSSGEKPVEELGVRAEDDYTLVVELEHPVPYFESLTTFGTFLPLNQKFVEEKGDQYALSSDDLVYNGPFKLVDWASTQGEGDEFALVKNPDYWDAKSVKLERMNYVIVKDTKTGVDLYNQGKVDRTGLSSDLVDQYASHEDFRVVPEASVFYLKMNEVRNGEKTPLANKNIRNAIARAINKEEYVNEVLNNGSLVANGLIPKNFVTVPDSGKDFRDVNGDLITYDPDLAKEYWEKGLQELGVTSLTIELLGDDGSTAKLTGEYFKNQLEKTLPGLTIELKNVPFEQRLEADNKQDYELQVAGWGPDYLDPNTFMSLWVTDGGNNKMGYSNPEYDRLIEEAATTYALDNAKRYENFLKAEKILMEDAAIAPLYQRQSAYLWSPKLQGVIVNTFGADFEYKWAYAAPVED